MIAYTGYLLNQEYIRTARGRDVEKQIYESNSFSNQLYDSVPRRLSDNHQQIGSSKSTGRFDNRNESENVEVWIGD